jgi:hypothetical protein
MDAPELSEQDRQMMDEVKFLARHAAWKQLHGECLREWREYRDNHDLPHRCYSSEVFRRYRDLTAQTFLVNEPDITDETLRILQVIAWQTQADFGDRPPIVAMVLTEMGNRGIFPALITLPDWFTGPASKNP